jgi:hemerythrin-like domain-containing protein
MLRDKNLVPLSRQHQHALALCVRISRAKLGTPAEVRAWQSEMVQHFEQEIRFHFAAEEAHLFPAARRFSELNSLVDELIADHGQLRDYFARACQGTLDRDEVHAFAEKLSNHIRKEERQLFEGVQGLMDPEELLKIGAQVEGTLSTASASCIVPTESKVSDLGS